MDFFLKLLSCQDKTVKYWYEKSESETTHLKVKSLQQNSPPRANVPSHLRLCVILLAAFCRLFPFFLRRSLEGCLPGGGGRRYHDRRHSLLVLLLSDVR